MMTSWNASKSRLVVDRRRFLVDEVYDVLMGLLMDGTIEPGDRMSIDNLARELDVSATPVREALARLESEGLVLKRPLKGYTSAPLLDRRGYSELFDLRDLLEPQAARLAAGRISPTMSEELTQSVRLMHSSDFSTMPAPFNFDQYRMVVDEDVRFHRIVASASGNALLFDSIVRLRAQLHLYRLTVNHLVIEDTHTEHSAIARAIADGDTEAAAQSMHQHLAKSRERIDSYLSSVGPSRH